MLRSYHILVGFLLYQRNIHTHPLFPSNCIFCLIPITDSGLIRSSILEVFDH